jgi:hypothetical protein
MTLANDDDVIKTFPSDRADQLLRIPILPRRPRRDRSTTLYAGSTLHARPKIPSNLNGRAWKMGVNLPYRLHSLRYNRGSPFSSLLAQDLFIRQEIRNVQGTTGKLARTSVGAVWVRHRGRGVHAGDRRELLKIVAAMSQLVKPSITRRYSTRWPRSRPALPGIAS